MSRFVRFWAIILAQSVDWQASYYIEWSKQSVKAVWLLWIFESFFSTHFFYFSFTLLEAQLLLRTHPSSGAQYTIGFWEGEQRRGYNDDDSTQIFRRGSWLFWLVKSKYNHVAIFKITNITQKLEQIFSWNKKHLRPANKIVF